MTRILKQQKFKTQIVVATYNGEQYHLLSKLLTSLTKVKSNGDFSVLIVDNMSDDKDQLEILKKLKDKQHQYPFDVRVIKNTRRGFDSGAYKHGIMEVVNTADYYLFIQDDIEFCQDYWDEIFINKFKEGQSGERKVLFTAFCGQKIEFNPHWRQIEWVSQWLQSTELGEYNCFGPMWFINNDNLVILLQSEYYQVLHTRTFPVEHKGHHQEGLESGMAALAFRLGYTINWVAWRDRGGLGPDHTDGRYHEPGWYPLYHTMAKVSTTRPNEYLT